MFPTLVLHLEVWQGDQGNAAANAAPMLRRRAQSTSGMRSLIWTSFLLTEGGFFVQLCLEQVSAHHPAGFDGAAWIDYVVQSSVDISLTHERASKYVAVTPWMHEFVQKCLDKLPH